MDRSFSKYTSCGGEHLLHVFVDQNPDALMVMQAYKHVFTSPSSVDKEPKATRSGNARIHGMTKVTPGSIAYIATQVHSYFLVFCSVL
jgi:hypothetical protein